PDRPEPSARSSDGRPPPLLAPASRAHTCPAALLAHPAPVGVQRWRGSALRAPAGPAAVRTGRGERAPVDASGGDRRGPPVTRRARYERHVWLRVLTRPPRPLPGQLRWSADDHGSGWRTT